jgi:hypothetical protein
MRKAARIAAVRAVVIVAFLESLRIDHQPGAPVSKRCGMPGKDLAVREVLQLPF